MQTDNVVINDGSDVRWDSGTKRMVGLLVLVAIVLVAYKARIVFVPVIIGAVVAYLLYPVARLTSRILRVSHGLATLLLYGLFLALLVPGVILLTPLLREQAAALQRELIEFTNYLETSGTQTVVIVPGIELGVQEIANEISSTIRAFVRLVATETPRLLFGASKTLLLVIFTVFIAYYMTADAGKIVAWGKKLIPPAYRSDSEEMLTDINSIWTAFFRGQVVLALVVTAIITALSAAIGLPQPFLMGILAGLLEFLVSVGHTIWLIIALILALVEGSTYLPVSNGVFALIVIGTNLIFTKVDLNILIPAIVGGRVRLHPMVVLIGIIVGASVGGVLGIALAAPTISSLRVVGRYIHAKLFDLEPPQSTPVVIGTGPGKDG